MNPNRKPYRNRWQLTDERMRQLEDLAAQGMPLRPAAREIGSSTQTVQTAAYREYKLDWLNKTFVKRQGKGGGQKRKALNDRVDGEIRRLKPEDIDAPLVVPNSPQTRWLTRAWAA